MAPIRPPLAAALALLTLMGACTLPETVRALGDESPPAELGRPGIVRVPARVGAWVGGVVGGVLSVVALPVTWPISRLADCPLGYSRDEFLFAPASMGAAAGHWLLGAPPDVLHWLLYRAWAGDDCEPASYDFIPMQPPQGPGADGGEQTDAGR